LLRTNPGPGPTVLFYLDRLAVGGPERVVVNLVAGLAGAGWRPAVALDQAAGELLPEIPPGVPVFDLGARRFPRAVKRLADLLSRERPDILVSQRAYLNVAAALAHAGARSASTRLVLAEHTLLARWLRDPRMPRRPVDQILPLVLPALSRRADAVVAISRGVAREMRQVLGVPAERIRVLYNPVVPPNLGALASRPVEPPWPADGLPLIVGAGRLSPEKGFDLLLEAFRQVLQVRPARLAIVGSGPEGPRLERLARDLGIAERTVFLGYRPTPYDWLARADLFVLSSLIESFPTVLIEAMALGKAVVAFDCPEGPREIVTDGVDGLLVPAGDVGRLAGGILRVLADPALAARLGDGARRRGADFGVEPAVARYMEFFAGLLAEARPRRAGARPAEEVRP